MDDNNDLPDLWPDESPTNIASSTAPSTNNEQNNTGHEDQANNTESDLIDLESLVDNSNDKSEEPIHPPKDFEWGPWLDLSNFSYRCRKWHQALQAEVAALAYGIADLKQTESSFVTLAEDKPANYKEAMASINAAEWRAACQNEYETLQGYHTWKLVKRPLNTNIVGSRWTFWVKWDNLGEIYKYEAWLVARGFSQITGIDYNKTYSPIICVRNRTLLWLTTCHNRTGTRYTIKVVLNDGVVWL